MKIDLNAMEVGDKVENIFIPKTIYIQEHKMLQRISDRWFINEKYDKVLIFDDDIAYSNKKEAQEALLENLEAKIKEVKDELAGMV